LRVPEDIAVTGCDGIEDGEYTHPRLTTIAQPYEEMSTLGWKFLLSRIKDPGLAPQRAILQPRLIISGSSLHRS
jgi:LacI family transcriptional regulator